MNDIEQAKRLFFEGLEYLESNNFEMGESRFIDTLKLTPESIPTLNNLAIAQFKQKKFNEAATTSTRAIEIKPNNADAYCMLAACQCRLKRFSEALATCERIISIDPQKAEAYSNRGFIFNQQGQFNKALADFGRAISIDPLLYEAHLNRGNTLRQLKRYEEALTANDSALALEPELADAWHSRGTVLYQLKRYDDALIAYEKALALKSNSADLIGLRLCTKLQLCDWTNFEIDSAHVIDSIRSGVAVAPPLAFISFCSSPAMQLKCSEIWTHDNFPMVANLRGDRWSHDRIRIAYISSEFRPHPVPQLIAGLLEKHDKVRFEVFGISLRPEHPSDMGRRIKRAFEKFIDVSDRADDEVADLIRELEIDILIDLDGYTGDSRTNILARRAAPIQVNYIGFPATMGAPYVDYIVADQILIPEDQREHYSEKIVYMPDSYQANDQERPIPQRMFTREKLGLPSDAFVFCCFNNNYKILPDVFDDWMHILKRTQGSVLWLLEDNMMAKKNLKKEAGRRGVDPDRLVFAPRMSPSEHLARHECADLFLDTLPYNAHTTASDALWVGLPVLTHVGETFAGRVAASLLRAIDLFELIAPTRQDYIEMAVELAASPGKLAAVKAKVAKNRFSSPLFDTSRYTRHIEAAYILMHERHQAGLAPENILVPKS